MTTGGRGAPRRRRPHRTRRSVVVSEWLSRALITVGGIGTIVAVSAVFLFLVWVVVDLFLPAEIGDAQPVAARGDAEVVAVGCDEYRLIGWALRTDGAVDLVELRSGHPLGRHPVDAAAAPLAVSAVSAVRRMTHPDPRTGAVELAVGFADGTARICRIAFETRFVEAAGVPAELRRLRPHEAVRWEDGVAEVTPIGQYRVQSARVGADPPVRLGSGAAIVALQHAEAAGGPVLAAVTAAGVAVVRSATRKEDMLTGESVVAWRRAVELPLPPRAGRACAVAVMDRATNVVVAWPDGHLARFAVRDPAHPRLAEELDVAAPGARLTAAGLLLGQSTLLLGDTNGRVQALFVVNDASNAVDGTRLVRGHDLSLDGGGAVRCIAASERERLLVAGTEGGAVHAVFVTSEKQLARARISGNGPVHAVAVSPKDDGILAAGHDQLWQWDFDPGHPEATLRSLFGKVWYERHDAPTYSWQSSSGTDAFEQKYSLVPLIFGTLKATFYSMLFGVPLALLAAIYTSEFLHRRTRARIKPLIELMASLPSVVLGFLAALVLAPLVEKLVPSVLCSFATVPATVLTGAFLWRLLPQRAALERWRLPAAGVAVGVGLWAAVLLGPAAERVLFAGDVRLWLDGQIGSGFVAWLAVLLPPAAVGIAVAVARWIDPWLRRATADLAPRAAASVQLLELVAGGLAVVGLSAAAAAVVFHAPQWLGAAEPWDLRAGLPFGSFDLSPLGTYDQRNALIVGFIMGFAVIPIIYTIAEDALSSVPEHLRAASLGAGATAWQTATRIVIPTAMSGLFSAVMIGLGRAVGETMIVLMATGGTPVMEMNAFSGFRTLSANIATELPEAPVGSTHYRTLFLAALVLFAMTFAINTLAETVRLRFRRRAYQL